MSPLGARTSNLGGPHVCQDRYVHEDWRSAEGEPWGYLRETAALALKAGPDRDTGLHRTGLEDYLRVIFPEISDWVHDRPCGFVGSTGKASRARPDYLSNELKLIVEFDGLQHYTTPDRIETDLKRTEFYRGAGFKVVRIPYFIQLTNAAVRKLFGVDVDQPLFDGRFASLGPKRTNSPAFLCPAGIRRMAREFVAFPEQYEVNLAALRAADQYDRTEWRLLAAEYNRLSPLA